MKAAIKEVLQKKGTLDENKLCKLVAKRMVDEYGEGKEKEFKNRFATDLYSLVSKSKVVDDKGVYSLFEKPAHSINPEPPAKKEEADLSKPNGKRKFGIFVILIDIRFYT